MKKLCLKILSVLASVVLLFSFTACDEVMNEINSALEQLQSAVDEMNNLMEYFEEYNFNAVLDGDGTITEEWVGTELDAEFVQPDSVTSFAKGYYEANNLGRVYSNSVQVTSMQDVDAYVQYLKGIGYDEYSELISWSSYNLMLAANAGKLCMALSDGENYVQVAYLEGESEEFNAIFIIADYDLMVAGGESNDGGEVNTPVE